MRTFIIPNIFVNVTVCILRSHLSDEIVDYSVVILDIMIPNFSLEDGVEKLDLKAGWDVGEYIYDEINTVSKGQMPILVLSGKDAKELNISIQGDNSIYIKKASSGDFPRDAILDALTTLTGFEIKKNFV